MVEINSMDSILQSFLQSLSMQASPPDPANFANLNTDNAPTYAQLYAKYQQLSKEHDNLRKKYEELFQVANHVTDEWEDTINKLEAANAKIVAADNCIQALKDLQAFDEETANDDLIDYIQRTWYWDSYNILEELIDHIYYCDTPGKEVVVTCFLDGTKIIKRPAHDDIFDLNVGVALCIVEYLSGSKSSFHKFIKQTAVCTNKVKKSDTKVTDEAPADVTE